MNTHSQGDYSPSPDSSQRPDSAERQDAMQAPAPLQATVPLEWAGLRLDKALVSLFPDFTRARLQDWLESGLISVNGAVGLKSSQKLRGLEQVVVTPQAPDHMQALVPEPVAFDVIHEDDACLVINKPAGLVVHPAAGHWSGTLMNGLLHEYPELLHVPRAGIVHRLDKDTTGLMVVARQQDTQQRLIREMAKRRIRRIYLALVWGRMTQRRTVEAAIGRDPRNRQKMAVVGHGKPAVTHFHPIALGQLAELPVTLLACKLETGRTHQIRVHALHAGFGLVGDPAYRQRGARDTGFVRQALHATFLAFRADDQPQWDIRSVAPVPDDFARLLEQAGIPVPTQDALYELPELWPVPTPQELQAELVDEDDGDEDIDVEVIYVRDDD